MQIILRLSLISSVLSQTFTSKYFRPIRRYPNRSDSERECINEGYPGLATILSVTDMHDARHVCFNTASNTGCWIGLQGTECTGPACSNYEWDDESSLTDYGFEPITGTAGNLAIANAYTSPDGPWRNFDPDTDTGRSCVYVLGPFVQSDNSMANEKLELGPCFNANLFRASLCNVPTPEVEIFFYTMTDETDASDWLKDPTNDDLFELPLVTNSQRCDYANEPSASPVSNSEASKILQRCWAITNDGSLTQNPSLTRFQSTEGFENCQLQFNMDPWQSIGGNACIVEYSIDEGTNWITIRGYGDDTENTVFEDLNDVNTNNNPDFGVRIVLDASVVDTDQQGDVECYFNNFYLRCDRGPTQDPTNDPSNDPTHDPTTDPTNGPTIDPTNVPTPIPTKRPGKPTKRPGKPTKRPGKPTKRPGKPTKRPGKPTKRPGKPTKKPNDGDCRVLYECSITEDCCPGHVDESVTCSSNVKWNDKNSNKNQKYCCVKNMGKCRNDAECCGGQTECNGNKCSNGGQHRAVVNGEQKELHDVTHLEHENRNIEINISIKWLMIVLCGIVLCIGLPCFLYWKCVTERDN